MILDVLFVSVQCISVFRYFIYRLFKSVLDEVFKFVEDCSSLYYYTIHRYFMMSLLFSFCEYKSGTCTRIADSRFNSILRRISSIG